MNKNIHLKALTVPLAIVLIIYLYLDRKDQKPYLPKTNPIARAEYEFMRTKSPFSGEIPEDIRRKELAFARTLPTRKEINEKMFNVIKMVSLKTSLILGVYLFDGNLMK